jgi:hypothetical protein
VGGVGLTLGLGWVVVCVVQSGVLSVRNQAEGGAEALLKDPLKHFPPPPAKPQPQPRRDPTPKPPTPQGQAQAQGGPPALPLALADVRGRGGSACAPSRPPRCRPARRRRT